MTDEELAERLEYYAGMEYSDEAQARRCVVNNFGYWVEGDYLATVQTVPEERKADFEHDLVVHRIGACENLKKSKGWNKGKLRQV